MTMAPVAVAQTQVTASRTGISEAESFQLTRNLLRIAMFNISYIRGLFPENFYQEKFVPAIEMKVKKLLPKDMESKRFIDWMEKGVFDALQKKYLRTLFFTICRGQDGPAVEEYIFSFKYAAKGTSEEIACMTIESSCGKPVLTETSNQTTQQMKHSACKMVRTLIQLMYTLDEVPKERTVIMKLHYNDSVTPADYEPPFFASCTQEAPHPWAREPLKMNVGKVDSRHYKLAIKLKSVLDPCQDDEELIMNETCSGDVKMTTSDDDSSTSSEAMEVDAHPSQPSSEPSQKVFRRVHTPTKAPESTEGLEEAFEEFSLARRVKEVQTIADDKVQGSDTDKTEDSEFEAESLRSVRMYLETREDTTTHLTDIVKEFPQISKVHMKELVERLVADEVLVILKQDVFHIKKTQQNSKSDKTVASQPRGVRIDPWHEQSKSIGESGCWRSGQVLGSNTTRHDQPIQQQNPSAYDKLTRAVSTFKQPPQPNLAIPERAKEPAVFKQSSQPYMTLSNLGTRGKRISILKKDLHYIKKSSSQIDREEVTELDDSTHQHHELNTKSAIPIEPVQTIFETTARAGNVLDSPLDADVQDQRLYEMALLYTLPREYVTFRQLLEALVDASKKKIHQIISQMAFDGYIEKSPRKRRKGREVFRTLEAEKKLQELRASFNPKMQKDDAQQKNKYCDNTDVSQPWGVRIRAHEQSKTIGVSGRWTREDLDSDDVGEDQQVQQESCSAQNKHTESVSTFKEPLLPRLAILQKGPEGPAVSEQNAQIHRKRIRIRGSDSPLNINMESKTEIVEARTTKASKVEGPIYQPPFKRVRTE